MNGGSPDASPRAMIAFGRRRSNAPLDPGRTAVMKFALHFGNNTFSDPEGARAVWCAWRRAAGFDSVVRWSSTFVFSRQLHERLSLCAGAADYRAVHRRNCPIR